MIKFFNSKSFSTTAARTSFTFEHLADGLQANRFKNICVMSGAGMSVSAGIPDFRTPGTGLYDNLQSYDLPYPEAIFEIDYFRKHPQPYYSFCHFVKKTGAKEFATPAHYFVRLLDEKRILHKYFTQNADDLESRTNMEMKNVIHAHGTTLKSHCSVCYAKYNAGEMIKALD